MVRTMFKGLGIFFAAILIAFSWVVTGLSILFLGAVMIYIGDIVEDGIFAISAIITMIFIFLASVNRLYTIQNKLSKNLLKAIGCGDDRGFIRFVDVAVCIIEGIHILVANLISTPGTALECWLSYVMITPVAIAISWLLMFAISAVIKHLWQPVQTENSLAT